MNVMVEGHFERYGMVSTHVFCPNDVFILSQYGSSYGSGVFNVKKKENIV